MRSLFICLALALVSSSYAQEKACDKTGLVVMQEMEKAQMINYEFELQELTLKDLRTNNEEKRQLQRFSRDTEQQKKALISFLSPTDIRGTALLSWENKTREDDQWLYLPALKRTQRIASSGKKNYFLGTDFTFADLESETLEEYNYECENLFRCGRNECYRIIATPKTPQIQAKTDYSKRIITVRSDNLTTLRIEYYDNRNELLKTLNNSNWKQHGSIWRPDRSVMTRHGVHETTMMVGERKVGEVIDDITFTERFLLNGMHMR
jgi:outer membrane lipoprotein-sorting protein